MTCPSDLPGAATSNPKGGAFAPSSPQELVIEGIMPDLNTLINAMKGHYQAYAKEKRRWTERTAWLCRAEAIAPVQQPVVVEFDWYSKNRRRDPDNLRIGSKFVLDGLVKAGVLPDDSQRWIVGFQDRFHVDKDLPRVVVRLVPQEDE